MTGKAIQAKPGSPENAAIPGIDEMYRPRKPNLDPDTNWPPWHPHLFILEHYYPVKSTVHYYAESKTKEKRVGRT